MSDFDTLRAMTGLIRNDEIRNKTLSFLNDKVPAYFKTVPASSSGKYHPAYTLGDGGLVRHTIAAVKIAHYLMEVNCSEEVLGLTPAAKDNIIAAIILHDTFKKGTTNEGDPKAYRFHEITAADEVSNVLGDSPIPALIAAHMGQWGACKPSNEAECIVHFADYLASRKCITVDVSGVL